MSVKVHSQLYGSHDGKHGSQKKFLVIGLLIILYLK